MTPTDAEIGSLYERYSHVVYHRARGILGDDEEARDAVQETFARVIRHWEQFRGEASPLTWMFRITTNWCLNQLRNRKGRADKRVVHHHDIAPQDTTWQRDHSEASLVRRLLVDADDETQRIVLHVYFDDMTRDQAAKAVGLSVPTVRKRLNHFFARCRAALEEPAVAICAAGLVLLLAIIGSIS
jgi:RNA polymerase sigma-70 factor, ECF subfamily